jgi:glutamine amidotransferase
MAEIKRLGFDQLVQEVSADRPFLGICVGMQALMERSEENDGVDCIGLFPGQVRFFGKGMVEDGEQLKVPHMGWNQVHQTSPHPLWNGIPQDTRFYFVHSYYADSADAPDIAGETTYALRFTSAAAHANIFAVQFHPEKSQRAGLRLLENFMSWDGNS